MLSNYKPPVSLVARSPQEIALEFARSQLNVKDSNFIVLNSYKTKASGTTHVYLQQTINGVKVSNGRIGVHLDKANKVIAYDDSFYKSNLTTQDNLHKLVTRQLKTWNGQTNGFVSPVDAFRTFAAHIKQTFDAGKVAIVPEANTPGGQSYLIKNVGFIKEDVKVSQSYTQVSSDQLVPVWDFYVKMPLNYFHVQVSADGAKIISMTDLVRFASYRVVKAGNNNPIDTPRELVTNPADKIASPDGWHFSGSHTFTNTTGNNIIAQENYNGDLTNRKPHHLPDGGQTLSFDFPFDPKKNPKDNIDASVTNAFYIANTMHDIFYHYGFDEAAGNYQNDNYNKGGLGNDAITVNVLAYYDDPPSKNTRNNAIFSPAPDGKTATITLLAYNKTIPDRDSAFSNDIIIHEYGHGVATRLVGGSTTIECMYTYEGAGMSEGYSDFFAYWMEMKLADKPTKVSENAKYPNAGGSRKYPYATNMAINPFTYKNLSDKNSGLEMHVVGTIWATMLYEMYWSLVSKLGFQENKYFADMTKGNSLALQIVLDGIKLLACNPTFISARNAILQAEKQLTGGKHACDIWRAFAKRGLGTEAGMGADKRRLKVQICLKIVKFDTTNHVATNNNNT
ncbi:Fungalysin metallopeptidase-domain-containing protein [Syncephalis fuscata]|nr:Fungalysin metallopeptidase-domain-containing protein [Syncephalis fuscata]